MTATYPVDSVSADVDQRRIHLAKHAYTTRHLDTSAARSLLTGVAPSTGDVVLARVTELGQHTKIERRDGRRASLFPGDEVIVAYGNRYAPDQFEAFLPADLGPCELVAAGGIAARVEVAHARMAPATSLEPLGILVDAQGNRINLRDGALAPEAASTPTERPITIAVVGASMNSGKTTAAAHLVRGMCSAGKRVGAAKTTGTGAGGDVWLLSDAGARPVYDFTSSGLPSTYGVGSQEVCRIFTELTDRLAADGCEVMVVEVADGVYQEETGALLGEPVFRDRIDAVLFAAHDALGAAAGAVWLEARGLAPLALTGVLSSSPLGTREAEAATGYQVWGLERLQNPVLARPLFEALKAGRIVRARGQTMSPDAEVGQELSPEFRQETASSPPSATARDASLTRVA